jgi:hypothetical protein
MMPRALPDARDYGLPVTVTCPFCAHDDTELHSPFGPQLSVATYWCRRCLSPFEFVKWRSSPGKQPLTTEFTEDTE